MNIHYIPCLNGISAKIVRAHRKSLRKLELRKMIRKERLILFSINFVESLIPRHRNATIRVFNMRRQQRRFIHTHTHTRTSQYEMKNLHGNRCCAVDANFLHRHHFEI